MTIKILSLTKISFHRVKIYLIPFLDARRWDILGNLVHWDWETPKYLLRVGIWNFWINVQWKCSWWDRGCVDKSNCNNLPFRVIVLQASDQQSVKCLEHLKCQFFNIFGLEIPIPTYWPVNNILKANFQWWYNRGSVMTLSLKKIHVTECMSMSIFLPPLLLMHPSLCRRMFLFATKQKSPFGAKICADIIFPRCKQFSKSKAQEKLWV